MMQYIYGRAWRTVSDLLSVAPAYRSREVPREGGFFLTALAPLAGTRLRWCTDNFEIQVLQSRGYQRGSS